MNEIKCPSCGSPNVEQIDTNKYQCPYCGKSFTSYEAQQKTPDPVRVNFASQSGAQFVPKPESNMGLAIFTTLCCCLPLGIFAVIKATKVNELYAMQQYEAAAMSAAEAKKWSYIGIGVGLVVNALSFIINIAAQSGNY